MRKVVLFMHVSLDGFVAGPNGELDWISYDQDLMDAADEIVKTVGSPIYGRVTYQMMENYWPTLLNNPESTQHDIDHANWIEDIGKIVISKSLKEVRWNRTTLINENIAEEIGKLKQEPGKDLVIFGSPSIAHTFIDLDLIDEYRLTVSPIVLGRGTRLFQEDKPTKRLNLLSSKTLPSGVLVLHYEAKKEQ
ncbi:dihydrofolate reductase [Paenibacillus sp. 5J-6]|uniref:Dihydrofolate reductase n=1 Tax=Paenibacillus silvestris TaxID=2606219 RepID=A0A6L8VBJ3_9BACL|nr:dihydrofolate reductase family protein [Paenibacillus silvestris]MZQ87041.1 dihydrofolate reductase [Paenibacillus silvestris]